MKFFGAPQRHPHILIFSIDGCCIEIVEELHYTNVLRISTNADNIKRYLVFFVVS
jgi:hypothetical protein